IVRDQFACNDFQKARLIACTRARNVIATLGPTTGKALLLSAHYDSVPVGPGAADDGIGVATLLEIGAILKDRPLKRPVMLLFNEGEELGLVGARAFLADPLSYNVDSLLNFEARGVTGPSRMFETSVPNGSAMSVYANAVRSPSASSLSTDLARLIPNDTDVTTYKERGWLTLNSAITGNETHYHSPADDLASLDTKSLQNMGDEGLALATRLSAGTPQTQGDRIFSDLFGRIFIQMPMILGAICLAILLVAFGAIRWRRGSLIRGTAVIFGALVAGGVLAWLAVTIMAALRAGTYWRAYPEVAFVAVYATTLLGVLAFFRAGAGKLDTRRLRAAYWFLFLLIGGALALVAPGGIIYFLIPPVAVLIGIIVSRWYRPAETIGALVGLLLLYFSWGELLWALEDLFSPGPLWIVAPTAVVMIAPALIEGHALFTRVTRRLVLLGSAAIALVAWIVAGSTPAYSQDRQQRFTIEHLTYFPSGRSDWSILNDGTALPEAYQSAGKWRLGKLPFSERQRWFAAAPSDAAVQPPAIQLLESLVTGNERKIRLRLKTNGAERIVLVAPEDSHIRSAGSATFLRSFGNEGSSAKFTISCTGRSCDGAELMMDIGSAKPVIFTIVGSRNGLPASASALVSARPKFARPQYTPDESVTIARVKL
ncbi:MAG TPA: M20/M25/M40 family metallo-hydrolase, partial [Sphingomicrobium sp.]|nr:M20/M25/M40 family metallo-hydrolase [Sphingomicrobium sp.]